MTKAKKKKKKRRVETGMRGGIWEETVKIQGHLKSKRERERTVLFHTSETGKFTDRVEGVLGRGGKWWNGELTGASGFI